MLKVVILGSAAGGGIPQWNCNCPTCRAAWSDPSLRSTQVSVAVSADEGRHWFLINASPDIRQQILQTPALHPAHDQLRQQLYGDGSAEAVPREVLVPALPSSAETTTAPRAASATR